MKISEMPDWALKYKGKNKSLKYLGNDKYGLYDVTSKYDKELGYSKSIQTFIGVISKDDGLVLKKRRVNNNAAYLEYGLSHFLYVNFKRSIQRSVKYYSNDKDYLVKLVIVKFIFGDISDEYIDMTYLCADDSKDIKEYKAKINDIRINNGVVRLKDTLKLKVSDLNDLNLLENHLRLITIRDKEDINVFINDKLKGLLDKYELKF